MNSVHTSLVLWYVDEKWDYQSHVSELALTKWYLQSHRHLMSFKVAQENV